MLFRILCLIVAATSVLSQSAEKTANPGSADQIRSMRQEIDKAFQRHDAKQLATLFSSDCHITAPTVHVEGSDALERFHGSIFLKRPDVTLIHHVNRIVVNENWGVASEQGEWMERWSEENGITELRGTYLTMWKKKNNHWLEYSEIIVPETCTGGSYCQ